MKRIAVVLMMLATVAACRGGSGGSSDGKLTIAVIPKGTTHVFWQMIHAGAEKAAQELDVSVIWRGPLREDDRASQISEVEGFITRGVSGIALAPLDEAALALPVADAQRQKIPVVIFDSGLKGSDYVSFVATDNRQGGRMAAEHVASRLNGSDYVSFVATDNLKGGLMGGDRLATSLHGKGKVILLRYAEGHDSTGKREQGFLDAMKANPGIEVVSASRNRSAARAR